MYRVGTFACVTALTAAVARPRRPRALATVRPQGVRRRVADPRQRRRRVRRAAHRGHPGRDPAPRQPRRAPLTTEQCEETEAIACYSPDQIRAAYQLPALYAQGITGAGETIVIVDSFGSPTIRADLATFDQKFGYPAPPKFQIITPAGQVPAFDPNNANMTSWAGETTLDVEYAHALAPGASILLVETPTSENEGTSGFPQIVKAEQYVIDHGLGEVISQSFSATEETFASYAQIQPLRAAYLDADRHHVTVLAASGDEGATDYTANGSDFYTRRVTSWPDSDPLVTGVGGTQLTESAARTPRSPGMTPTTRPRTSTGAARPTPTRWPAAAARPSTSPGRRTRTAVEAVTGARRGVPDISMSAACDGAVNVYSSFANGPAGWSLTCGTSEATPEFAAIVALADQVAGHPLGLLNPALYALLAAARARPGRRHRGQQHRLLQPGRGQPGTGRHRQRARRRSTPSRLPGGQGYNLVTGVGTVNASKFVYELAAPGALRPGAR